MSEVLSNLGIRASELLQSNGVIWVEGPSDRVYIKRVGEAVILLPYQTPWKTMLDSLSLFSADFMAEREQPPVQDREDAYS